MSQPPRIFPRAGLEWLPSPFSGQRLWRFAARNLTILFFLAINSFVFFNAYFHPPTVGYDAGAHLFNIQILAEGRLPTPADSDQFFSPPLPYALPALAAAAGLPPLYSEKLAQLINGFLSLAAVLSLIGLARLIYPGQRRFTVTVLAFLALMPVYYKSFSFIRGEPWVTLFAVLIAYELLALIFNRETGKKAALRSLRLGTWLGLAILSRQWGFLLWISTAVFFLIVCWKSTAPGTAEREARPAAANLTTIGLSRRAVIKSALFAFTTAMVIGGWFYLDMQVRYGSFAAFNRPLNTSFSLTNHPPSFFTGLGSGKLFSDPVRPSFPNQFWPKFYAEFWGDYEAYFLVYGRDTRSGKFLPGIFLEEAMALDPPWLETNKAAMSAYLGRANAVALSMTALFVIALLFGAQKFWLRLKAERPQRGTIALALVWLMTAVSIAGYLVFVIVVPNPGNGDTVKAVYLLHTTPLIALLSAGLMEAVRARTKAGYGLLWLLIIMTYLYLIPTFYTRYF